MKTTEQDIADVNQNDFDRFEEMMEYVSLCTESLFFLIIIVQTWLVIMKAGPFSWFGKVSKFFIVCNLTFQAMIVILQINLVAGQEGTTSDYVIEVII